MRTDRISCTNTARLPDFLSSQQQSSLGQTSLNHLNNLTPLRKENLRRLRATLIHNGVIVACQHNSKLANHLPTVIRNNSAPSKNISMHNENDIRAPQSHNIHDPTRSVPKAHPR
jgi:hypothetical protein